ncbi:hypothetical protein ACC785_37120, partial [Rhizobium ruizarguesonis]
VIDTMIADTTEAAQRFGGMDALGQPYMKISFAGIVQRHAGQDTTGVLDAKRVQRFDAFGDRCAAAVVDKGTGGMACPKGEAIDIHLRLAFPSI